MEPAFSWSYALSTLFIRFFGIFLVLGILQIALQVSGRVFRVMDERREAKDTVKTAPVVKEVPGTPAAVESTTTEDKEDGEAKVAAAIGVALHLYAAEKAAASRGAAAANIESFATGWRVAGRLSQLHGRLNTPGHTPDRLKK